jgi:RNA polymerase sigma-70 factor (ECF subfamily)
VLSRFNDSELERHIPAMRRFAWSLTRDRDKADDLVQEALLRAVSRWAQLRNPGSVRPWLLQILYNAFRAELRRRHGEELSMPSDTDAQHPAAIGHPEDKILLRSALGALARLPEDQRAVLELVAIEGLSYEEVSRIVDVPLGTVMSRLSRARETLRELMGDRPPVQLRRVK